MGAARKSIELIRIRLYFQILMGCWIVPLGNACPESNKPDENIRVVAVSSDIIGIQIQQGRIITGIRGAYQPEEGDRLEPSKATYPVWASGTVELQAKETFLLRRENTDADWLIHGKVYQVMGHTEPHLWREQTVIEAWQGSLVVDDLAFNVYQLIDGSDFEEITIHAVYRKTKPNGDNQITGEKTFRHQLYLKLAESLEEGCSYQIVIKGIGEDYYENSITYDPRKMTNEAIHVNQIGYRPDDPFKRAYLSLWMGDGGGYAFDVESFEILDAHSGESVYQGRVLKMFPADQPESFRRAHNAVQADVHYLDFHDFNEPGTYKIYVPGVGVSLPFRIADDSWAEAFRTSMHGLLSHRSGVEIGPPFSDYRRPRNMHPEDGFKIVEIPYTMLEGEADIVSQAILEKMQSDVPANEWSFLADAWGGYMDAGDWDRRSQHLMASLQLIELFSLNPTFFETLPLALPVEEAQYQIPDILYEVIWNVSFYRRLQDKEGGVRGGIESTSHPSPGQASWEETLVLGVFAPDPYSSYSYAAAAALLAKQLKPYDDSEAEAYLTSAIQAWEWAEKNTQRVLDEASARLERLPEKTSRSFQRARAERRIEKVRMIAGSALYAGTGEEKFHHVFMELFAKAGNDHEEMGAYFHYARLPEDLAKPEIREEAIGRILRAADRAIGFGVSNAFGLHTQVPDIQIMGYTGFYSVPEMVTGPVLPRAYMLTEDSKYLAAALKAAHYSSGANPMNRTFTTGVGQHYPQNPLHIDSRVSGQPAPQGITIYGPSDPAGDFPFNEWVHKWHLQDMYPPSRTWPAAEWHVDLFLWPAMSEYTIHQTIRPTSYYWGFLAARE